MRHRDRLDAAVRRAREHNAIVVAANDDAGVRWLPGCLTNVVPVRADWTCARDTYGITFVEDRAMMTTSPYPRDIPGVPRDRNVHGVSFAVANATGFVARALEALPPGSAANLGTVFDGLEQAACHDRARA
jgi:hypothetical protein